MKGVAATPGETLGSSHLISPTCGMGAVEGIETGIQSVANRSTLEYILVLLSLKFSIFTVDYICLHNTARRLTIGTMLL